MLDDMTSFNGLVWWTTIVRSFLGEMADKTFFLAVVFTVWDPTVGIRSNDLVEFERTCALSGVFAALALRIILLGCGVHSTGWNTICDILATVTLAVLLSKAYFQRGGMSETGFIKPKQEIDTTSSSSPPSPASYAATVDAASTGDSSGPNSAPWAETKKPSLLLIVLGSKAFLFPFIAALLLDSGDYSGATLLDGPHTGLDFVLGALMGLGLTISFAAFIGISLGRALDDARLLFLVTLSLGTLFLVNVSQTLLHFDVLHQTRGTHSIRGSTQSVAT